MSISSYGSAGPFTPFTYQGLGPQAAGIQGAFVPTVESCGNIRAISLAPVASAIAPATCTTRATNSTTGETTFSSSVAPTQVSYGAVPTVASAAYGSGIGPYSGGLGFGASGIPGGVPVVGVHGGSLIPTAPAPVLNANITTLTVPEYTLQTAYGTNYTYGLDPSPTRRFRNALFGGPLFGSPVPFVGALNYVSQASIANSTF